MFFSLKDSFLKTINTLIVNNHPTIATATVGSFCRIFVFIDGSNLYHSLVNSFGNAKIDLGIFCESISKEGLLLKINYYTSPVSRFDGINAYKSQQKFLSKIIEIPKLVLFLGRLEKHGNSRFEKGVDVKIATDLVSSAFKDNFDVAILVSNDSDFVPAIKEVQQVGKKVWNINFQKRKSYHLNQICDKTITIESIDEFLVKK